MNLKRRLEQLEAKNGADEVPWWSLPPGEEPDWPRPLIDWTDEALEELSYCQLEKYCDAHDAGREYRPTHEEVWLDQEAFHELRWRRYGIARRSQGLPPPKGWEQTENLHKKEEEDE
jgi:hypothetical protein